MMRKLTVIESFYALVTLIWAILFVSAAFFIHAIAYLLLGGYFVFSLAIFALIYFTREAA